MAERHTGVMNGYPAGKPAGGELHESNQGYLPFLTGNALPPEEHNETGGTGTDDTGRTGGTGTGNTGSTNGTGSTDGTGSGSTGSTGGTSTGGTGGTGTTTCPSGQVMKPVDGAANGTTSESVQAGINAGGSGEVTVGGSIYNCGSNPIQDKDNPCLQASGYDI